MDQGENEAQTQNGTVGTYGSFSIDKLALARIHLFYGSQLRLQKLFEPSEKELQIAASTVPEIRHETSWFNSDDIIVEFIALYETWCKPEKAAEYRQWLEEVRATFSNGESHGGR